jgi:hypothetical protein
MCQTKVVEENQNTLFVFNNFVFSKFVPYSDIVENIVERGKVQTKLCRLHIAFWILKATDTHSEYVKLITVSLQQWLCERPLMLRYTYIPCLV